MTSFLLDRRALLAAAAGSAALAATPALAKQRRRFIINALGSLGDPNSEGLSEAQIAAHYLFPRPIEDARAAGVAAVNATIGYVFGEGDPFAATVEELAWWGEALRLRSDTMTLIRTAADIVDAYKTRKAGVIFGFQNSEMFGDDASRASLFSDLGVRIVQLTYNLRNRAGDGALVPENTGLTDFGRDLVAALNEKKLLVDLSHAGEKTTYDAIKASKAPIAITHTGCAALAPHPRNKTDAEMKAVSDGGGVVGVYFMPYLTPGRQHLAADIVAHIDHALDVCGEDHVGIGTDNLLTAIDDMPGYRKFHREDTENRKKLGVSAPNEDPDIITAPPDLLGPTQFDVLAAMLGARGHKEARIEKVLGGNFLRLFGEVWGG